MDAFVERYRRCFVTSWSDQTPTDRVRFVVLDTETTGLNPRTDRIVTIGAIDVQDGEILVGNSFECLLRVPRNTAAVEVHGVTRDESARGIEEPEALTHFLDYLRDSVIVGHHIGHDIAVLNAAYEHHWGLELMNRHIDTMDLTLHLERSGAFADRDRIREFTLDALCDRFGVVPHDRHTAGGDAFITAQVFLRLLRLASRHGREQLGPLCEPFQDEVSRPAKW